jgi:MFS family permease
MRNKYITIWQKPLVRMLVITAIIGTIGASLYNVVLVQYAAKLTHADLAVIMVSIAGTIPYLVQSIPGKIADQTKNKLTSLFVSSCIQAILFFILAFLVTNKNWYILIIVITINVISDSLELYNNGLVATLQQRHVEPELMETTTGLIRSSALLISMGGQSLGVAVLTATNYNFSILAMVNCITFALVAIIVSRHMNIDHNQQQTSSEDTERVTESGETNPHKKVNFWLLMSQIFKSSPKLFTLASFLGNFMSASLIPLANVALLHQTSPKYSYAVSVLIVSLSVTLGNLIGSFFADVLFKHKNIVTINIISNCVLILFFISFFIIQLETLSYILLFIFALISGVSNIKTSANIMKKVPNNQLASFYTSFSSLMYLSMPLGMTVIPAVALLGNTIAFTILVGLTTIMIMMLISARYSYEKKH